MSRAAVVREFELRFAQVQRESRPVPVRVFLSRVFTEGLLTFGDAQNVDSQSFLTRRPSGRSRTSWARSGSSDRARRG